MTQRHVVGGLLCTKPCYIVKIGSRVLKIRSRVLKLDSQTRMSKEKKRRVLRRVKRRVKRKREIQCWVSSSWAMNFPLST